MTDDLGESEVEKFRSTTCREPDVARFDVAMENARAVERFQSFCQIDAHSDCFTKGQRSIPETVLQCPLEAFNDEQRCPAPEFNRVDRGELRMRDGCHRLCFAPQLQ